MVDRVPQKQDEQYPLLKVDMGSGDGGTRPPVSNTVSPGWSVTCNARQSWLDRWPEYLSACWMTTILLGITFLVFYAVGLGVNARQPILVMKCNSSRPASDVYYHSIIQRGSYVPFMLYSDYLSNMALQYPALNFNVYFLLDDSIRSSVRELRHTKFIKKLIPYYSTDLYNKKLDEINRRQMRDFQIRYQNVNVTIMPLSKYMDMTPLRFKWRNIPQSYLPFYARLFSVWQTGGIGMDLATFKNRYSNRQRMDRRITAILRQHNDGIKPEEYTNALNVIDRDEENEFFSMFYDIMQQIYNETRSFFNKTLALTQSTTERIPTLSAQIPLIRTHRSKRDILSAPLNLMADSNLTEVNTSYVSMHLLNKTEDNNIQYMKKNEYQMLSGEDLANNNTGLNTSIAVNLPLKADETKYIDYKNDVNNTEGQFVKLNNTENPSIVLFYDFSIFSDGIMPFDLVPEALIPNTFVMVKPPKPSIPKKRTIGSSQLLSIALEGVFVAASSRLHPFLGHIISAGCQRMHPKVAIQDALLTQCAGIFRNDIYCNNIYVL